MGIEKRLNGEKKKVNNKAGGHAHFLAKDAEREESGGAYASPANCQSGVGEGGLGRRVAPKRARPQGARKRPRSRRSCDALYEGLPSPPRCGRPAPESKDQCSCRRRPRPLQLSAWPVTLVEDSAERAAPAHNQGRQRGAPGKDHCTLAAGA
jgi:hypothetical protein